MAYRITDKCDGSTACVRMCPVGAISGEKGKVHHINEELCIECGVCGRICHVSAIVDRNGRPCEKVKKDKWPIPEFQEGCVACTTCVETCPFACLDIADPGPGQDKHSHSYLKNQKSCVGCGMCESVCPMGVIVMKSP